jgi:hypothetical protein
MIFKSPNVYEGKWIADPKHGDPDRPLFYPPVSRRKKKKGRTKNSRHTSGGEVGRKNGRAKKSKEISSSSVDEPPDDVDIHTLPFADIFGASDSDDDKEVKPQKAAQEKESDEQSAEETVHQSRASVYKAGRNLPGKRLPRRRRGMPDRQPRVQPQNTMVPTKSAGPTRNPTRAAAAARSPDLADESAEQSAADIRDRLEAGIGSDEASVSSES